MKNKRIFAALGLLMLMLPMLLSVNAFALDTKCSLTVNCVIKENDTDRKLVGETFAIVKIADCKITKTENNQILNYKIKDRFSSFDCAWGELTSSQLRDKAKEIASDVKSRDYVDIKTTDKNGQARFELKDTGLYLVIRTKSVNTDVIFDPCIISVPQSIDGELSYDVTSTPKLGSDDIGHHGSKDQDTGEDIVSKDNGTHLPQTGQLILPILILAAGGIPMIIAGICLLRSGKKNEKD